MFKKFKDKLAEEMKQSPARLQASMQQLAQAVVSPALSNSSIQELSASNDNFSLTEGGDETPKNSPARHGFQNVDLTSTTSNSMGVSRRSSVSSVTSVDAASFFPIYESPVNIYHLQSDMEQSASEVDENITPQLDRISKDQLYAAYRKVQVKYNKYRGRYTDLANHYREMERVKGKLESLLVETQDKALRRIGDLKEQCQLEQQAKAHLEGALRNDIEEKDHVIDTLNTKVRLLQANGPFPSTSLSNSIDHLGQNETGELLLDLSSDLTSMPSQSALNDESHLINENIQLRGKLEKLEILLNKYKETSKRNKEKMSEVLHEKSITERDFEISRKSSNEKFAQLEDDLNVARNEILNLRDQMTIMRKREEESVISLAENKLTIHRELEVKEEQIKKLQQELKIVKETREELQANLELYKTEFGILKNSNDRNVEGDRMDGSMGKKKVNDFAQDKMDRRIIEIEEIMGLRLYEEETKNRDLMEKLALREEDLRIIESEAAGLRQEAENYREVCESLRDELSRIKDREYSNEIGNRSFDAKRFEAEKTNEMKSERKEMVGKENSDEREEKKNQAGKKVNAMEKFADELEGNLNEKKLPKLEQKSLEKGTRDEKQAECNEKGENYYQIECEKLREELSSLKIQFKERDMEILREKKQRLDENTKIQVEKDEIIQQLNLKIQTYVEALKTIHERAETQQSELNLLRNNSGQENEFSRLREDCENKSIEILGIERELKSCKSTIKDLREKIRSGVEKIDLLMAEKKCLISNILEYKKIVVELKESCQHIKSMLSVYGQNSNEELEKMGKFFAENFKKIATFEKEKNDESLKKLENIRDKLKGELDEKNVEILELREKVDRWNETSKKNNRLMAEIDQLNFKIFDLEKLQNELKQAREDVENLKLANSELTRTGEESAKLTAELENREKTMKNDLMRLQDLKVTNEDLRKNNEILINVNSEMKFEYENKEKSLKEKNTILEDEILKFTSEYEKEKKHFNDKTEIDKIEFLRLKTEHENHEKLVLEYAEKLKFFEGECAKREAGLEKLRIEMEEREKLLQDTMEKLKNFELEISKLSEERSNLALQLESREKSFDDMNEKREKLLKNMVEKSNSDEAEIFKLSEEKSKLLAELENREKLLKESMEKSNNFEENFTALTEEKTKLSMELKNREKSLQEMIEKSQNFEHEFSKVSNEKSKLLAELGNREQLLKESMEKSNNYEATLSDLAEEKTKLSTELHNRDKKLQETIEKMQNFEVEFSKFSEEKAKFVEQLQDGEKNLESVIEKSKHLEMELSKVTEEKSNLTLELKEREKLLQDSDEKLKKILIEFSKLSEEKTEKAAELESLRNSSIEYEDLNEALKETINSKNVLLKKLKALKDRQAQTIQESEMKISTLEEKLEKENKELAMERVKSSKFLEEISMFQEMETTLKKNINEFEENISKFSEEKENLLRANAKLEEQILKNSSLRENYESLESEKKQSKELINELEKSNVDLAKSETVMREKFEELEKICASQVKEIVVLKEEISRHQEELKKIGENAERLENIDELRKNVEQSFRLRTEKIEEEYAAKCREKELEVKNLAIEFKSKLEEKEMELRSKIENVNEDDRLKKLVEELQIQLQNNETKLLNSEVQRSQIESFNDELKNEAEKLREVLETSEVEQSMRLKQLVKEFQAQLHDKDEELQSALDKRFESQQNYESELVQQYREQLKEFQIELTAKSEEIESLVVERKKESETKQNDVEKLIETINKIKHEHANELVELERKWKVLLKQKSDQLEAKHDEEVIELTQEWQNERRNDVKIDESQEELENTSRVALATVQSNTGSFHSLQQTMVSQRRELAELRKIVKIRQDTLEDSTEIEYLKNILYEYMMGRETMVLARVIAAIVKFDQEQTTKILKKEEDKLTLLGSLGLT